MFLKRSRLRLPAQDALSDTGRPSHYVPLPGISDEAVPHNAGDAAGTSWRLQAKATRSRPMLRGCASKWTSNIAIPNL